MASRVSDGLPFALKVSFTIYNHGSKAAIYLSHPSDLKKDSLISGFPRCLLIDDAIAEGKPNGPHLTNRHDQKSD